MLPHILFSYQPPRTGVLYGNHRQKIDLAAAVASALGIPLDLNAHAEAQRRQLIDDGLRVIAINAEQPSNFDPTRTLHLHIHAFELPAKRHFDIICHHVSIGPSSPLDSLAIPFEVLPSRIVRGPWQVREPPTILVLAGELGATSYPGGFESTLAPLFGAARTIGSLQVMISGSPRTTTSCYQQLDAIAHSLDMIGVSATVYRQGSASHNPYVDWVRRAHAIIVGNDSASMLSDAVASGKPTLLATTARSQAAVRARLSTSWDDALPIKHCADVRDYHAVLIRRGRLRFLIDASDLISPVPIRAAPCEWDAHAGEIADVATSHFDRPGGMRSPTGRLRLLSDPSRPPKSSPAIPPKRLDE